ncbi:hypothetical protein [Francisella frigiditurris]|uniref:Putative integral membrane protein n=1 Tax=Francisella frigiditurris TaxID=1542390 RepID=A0A1J0KRR7_9GAMM|nr:hypothetical protein [Francisella frigiditurris]APC96407.1 putative integral membrane protein [Francisella frigiditurris]
MTYMIYKLLTGQDQYPKPTFKQSVMLAFTGVAAFVADTIGVGSFAINIALGKTLKLVKDAEIPGFLSGAQVMPGAIEAVFFLEVLHVDVLTLVVLVLGATIGGFIGGIFASKISTAAIRLIMIFAFVIMMFLLIGKLLNILPIGGTLMKLTGYKLVLGFVGMIFAGFLVCFGVRFFCISSGYTSVIRDVSICCISYYDNCRCGTTAYNNICFCYK